MSVSESDRQLIRRHLEAFMDRGPHVAPILDEYEPHGVPIDMQMGEPDEDGYVAWKTLPSEVEEAELEAIEGRMPGPFPRLFRAYLTTHYVLGLNVGDIVLPHIPPHNPLRGVQETVQRWHGLFDAGFVAFAENQDGPLVFDLQRRHPETGDCPVLCFDREELAAIGEDQWLHRELLLPSATYLFPSFEALLEHVFAPPEDAVDAVTEDLDQ